MSFTGRNNLLGRRGTGGSPRDTTTSGKLTAKYTHYLKRKKATSGNSSEKNRTEGTLAGKRHLLS
jgi:hypothetical protein